jgi:hypothetical protein
MATGVSDITLIDNLSLTPEHRVSLALIGVKTEFNPGFAVFLIRINFKGMNGGSPRTGVDFGLDSLDTQLRQREPLAPAHSDSLLCLFTVIHDSVQHIFIPVFDAFLHLIHAAIRRADHVFEAVDDIITVTVRQNVTGGNDNDRHHDDIEMCKNDPEHQLILPKTGL